MITRMKITKHNLKDVLECLGYTVIPEYKFCRDRKFRADWLVTKEDERICATNNICTQKQHSKKHRLGCPEAFMCSFNEKNIAKNGVLIEYEGIIAPQQNTAPFTRHTTIKGYTKDTEKYNTMTKLGYRCLRYTAKNVGDVVGDLEEVFGISRVKTT